MKLKVLFAQFALFLALGPCRLFGQVFISSFSPTFGSHADMTAVSIFGSGFSNTGLIVKFNGVQDLTAQATSSDTIQAQVPATAPVGPGKISVQVGSSSTLSTNTFFVLGTGPYVSDFSPSVGGGGTLVTINGAQFSNPITVKFNTGSTNGNLVASSTQFQVNVPVGATTGFITVTTSTGSYTTTNQTFYVPPSINGFSPSVGRAGTNVLITGQNLLGATAVTFGGVSASFTPPTTNTSLQAVVPPNAVTGQILVTAPAGSAQTSSNFVVQPTIYGFSPGFGLVGTSVTVTGANFNVSGFSVKFGGVTAPSHSTPAFGSFTVTVPTGATNAPIMVTTTDGSHTSSQVFYLPPVITGFTPNNSAAFTTVAITGINFVGTTAVSFNGTPAGFTVTNNTTIGAVVPAGITTGPISVTTPAGTTNSGLLFFYVAPVVSGFSPTHGLPGTSVMISGVDFLGATAVLFAGTNAAFTVTNNTTLGAVVPANARTGPITVIAPAGAGVSSGNFTVDSSDIAVTATDSPDPVFVGSNLVYTITVMNNGPADAANVKFTNALPASVRLLSAATSQGSLNTNANPILGTLGTLNNGGSATLTLTVMPLAPGTIVNTASAGSDSPDPVPANNSAAISTVVWPLPILSIAPSTNQVQVSWPAALSNFTLQYKSALGANYNWSNLTVAPVLAGSNNVVTDPDTNSSRFYRLKL
jgi:uncharacterized repeat protein (TIGR01451 family)